MVSAGVNPCYGLGILTEPSSVDDYYRAIRSDANLVNNMSKLRLFSYYYFIQQCFRWPLTKRSLGDNFTDFDFSSADELKLGQIEDLDKIFDEIDSLVDDFNSDFQSRDLRK